MIFMRLQLDRFPVSLQLNRKTYKNISTSSLNLALLNKMEPLTTETAPIISQPQSSSNKDQLKQKLSKKLQIFYPVFHWLFLGYLINLSATEAVSSGYSAQSKLCQSALKLSLKSAFGSKTTDALTSLQDSLAIAYYQIFDPFWAFFALQYFYLLTYVLFCVFLTMIFLSDDSSPILSSLAVGRQGLRVFLDRFFQSTLLWSLCFLGPALSPLYYIYFFYAKDEASGCLMINMTDLSGVLIIFVLGFYLVIWIWLYFIGALCSYKKQLKRNKVALDMQGKPNRFVQFNTVLQDHREKLSALKGLEKVTVKGDWEIEEVIEKGQLVVKDLKLGTTMKKNNQEINKQLETAGDKFDEKFYDEKINKIMIIYKRYIDKDEDRKDCIAALFACLYLFFFFFHVIVMAALLIAGWVSWLLLLIFVKGTINKLILALIFGAPLVLGIFITLVKQVESNGFKSLYPTCFSCKKLTPEEKAKRAADKKAKAEARAQANEAKAQKAKQAKEARAQKDKEAKEAQAQSKAQKAKEAQQAKEVQEAKSKKDKELQAEKEKQKQEEIQKAKQAKEAKSLEASKAQETQESTARAKREEEEKRKKQKDEEEALKKKQKEEEEALKKQSQEEEKLRKAEEARKKKEAALEKKRKAAEMKRGAKMEVGDVDRSGGGPLKVGEQVETKFKDKKKRRKNN